MGCSTCNKSLASISRASASSPENRFVPASSNPACPYSVEMLFDFRDRLIWFKQTAAYIKYNIPAKLVNKYTGIVLTSLNISNHCQYEDILNQVSNLVDLIIVAQNA